MYFNIIGKATDIDYDITEEDLDLEEGLSQKEIKAAIKKAKAEVEEEHGKEMTFYLTMDEDDLDAFEVDDPEDIDFEDPDVQDFLSDLVGDYISDETDYCLDGFNIDFDSCHVEAPTYQVVAFGYDAKNRYVDDVLIDEDLGKSEAIKAAKKAVDGEPLDFFNGHKKKDKIKYVNIEVETVLKDSEDSTVNMDTIWTDSIEVA